jgi:Sulfotransferase family
MDRDSPRVRQSGVSESASKTRYVIVGMPRSGTTLIHKAVAGHPDASALNDELCVSPFWDRGLSTFTFGHETPEERRAGHVALFDAVTSIAASAATRAFGVKCCVSSPREAELVVASATRTIPGVKMIVVLRRDLVAQYASLLRARRSGAWHSWRHPDRPPVAQVHIRPLLFDRYTTNALDTLARLQCAPAAHVVVFEELVASKADGFREIFHFLDLPDVPIDWDLGEKVSPAPEAYIDNYLEMSNRLASLVERHTCGTLAPSTRFATTMIDLASRGRRMLRRS